MSATLSTEERISINNGIWLCQNHAKLIDNDAIHYTVELIRSWKLAAENTARRELEGFDILDVNSAYAGMLTPALLYSPSGTGIIPIIQIGQSQVFLGPDGIPGINPIEADPIGAKLLPGLKASQFKVEIVDAQVKFSTQVCDETGRLIAEINRNEWKVAPPPGTWDRNYSNDALEVRDPRGRVVLQVRVLINLIQIQGAWSLGPEWKPAGAAQVIIRQDPANRARAQFLFYPINPKPEAIWPDIIPIFEYPSELHLGELRKLSNP